MTERYKETNIDCDLCLKPGRPATKKVEFQKTTVRGKIKVYACPQCDLMLKRAK